MIERMKKITLLVSEKDREKFVPKLRKTGVVHIRHIKTSAHHEIDFIEDKIAKITRMIAGLFPFAKKEKPDARKPAHETEMLEIADEVIVSREERKKHLADIDQIKRDIKWFETWGVFHPRDLGMLKEKGVEINLYCLKKDEYKRFRGKPGHYVLARRKGYVYLATVSLHSGAEIPFEKVKPPGKTPEEMVQRIEDLTIEIGRIEDFLKEKAHSIGAAERCREKLEKEYETLKVRFGMQEEGEVAYLQGFCPAKKVDKIISMAKNSGVGYVIEEPDDPDEVPTLITNPKWLRMINPVFRFMNTVPGYNEFDISFYFLVFLSLFFAMLIGDAGYGLLFLAITFLARCRLRNLSWEPFFLMYLFSVGTIIWGALTGTWFGAEKIAQLPFLNNLIIAKVNSFSGDNQHFMIFLCFVIGVVHLTIAHLLKAVRVINSFKVLAEVGWIMILWGMFFAAGKFVLSNVFPPQAGWLLIGGMVLVLFCSNPEKGFIKGTLSTLAELPLGVISSFSDIVSYLRLFAVGFATVVVAESFNNMALGGGISGVLSGIAAVMILFLGHTLNILLGCMAVIVHGIRLNMLEFSGHLGMQWSGKKYEPFCDK